MDLIAVAHYVAADNLTAAANITRRIQDSADALGLMATGRRGRVSGAYEKLVQGLPYILAYALSDKTVFILHVIHTARDWREGGWPP